MTIEKIGFTVDALHLIETMADLACEEGRMCAPGMVIGLQLIYELLQKIEKRAVELNDKEMLGYMERLHLVERTKETGDGR